MAVDSSRFLRRSFEVDEEEEEVEEGVVGVAGVVGAGVGVDFPCICC